MTGPNGREAASTGPYKQRRFDNLPLRATIKKTVRSIAKLEGAIAIPERHLYVSGRLSTARLRLPDFLGIGAVKAATTWLYENLRAHPEAFLPDKKELHYFNLRRHKRLRWYASHFERAGGRITGEITPSYGSMPPERVAEVAALLPHARLLLVVRNPIDRAWSHAVMTLARKHRRSIEDVDDRDIIEFLQSAECQAAGDYATMIENWTAQYPAEQLLIAPFDEVAEHPTRLLTTVFEHVGLSTTIDMSKLPASSVIDRGAGGSGTIVGKAERPTVPDRFRPMLDALYVDSVERLRNLAPVLDEPWLGQVW